MQPDDQSARASVATTRSRAGFGLSTSVARVKLISAVCAGLAGLLALIGLSGWVFGMGVLTRLSPGLTSMKANTALMLLLLAIAGLTRPRTGLIRSWAWVSSACAALVAAIAAYTMVEYLSGHDLGIDQLLFTDPGGVAHPGRPSIATAVCALLLAVAALRPVKRSRWLTETMTLAVFAASFLAVLGFVYGVDTLQGIRPHTPVSLPTAVALLLLSITGLSSVDRGVMAWIVGAAKPGATLMRIIAPAALILLPAVGYLCVLAAQHGLVTGDALVDLIVVYCIAALIAVGWVAGVRLDHIDTRRKRALAQLHALAQDLEQQVAERSNQVQVGRDEVVLLAERQRIAADLHDIVVQRLFAAGMSLNAVSPSSVEPSVGSRIDSAVESMDAAILDLRSSIFELSRSTTDAIDLTSALDTLCIEAARVLGFLPDLTVDDPDDDASELRVDILPVIREALSNVAKHAQASSAQVVLRTDGGVLALEIIDDGIGITDAPHNSGTQNISDRARRWGGECSWTPVEPHGTRVRWQVPIASITTSDRDGWRSKDVLA